MRRQTAYITYNALEEIFLFENDYPELYKIIYEHSNIMLDLDKEDFEEKSFQNPFLKALMKRGSLLCRDLKPFFDSIDETPFDQFSRDIFIIDKDESECKRLSEEFGVLIVSSKNPKGCNLHQPSFHKNLLKGSKYSDVVSTGWNLVLRPISFEPFNSIIIFDNYIFQRNIDNGIENIISFLSGILPKKLNVTFHILIVFFNGDNKVNPKQLTDSISKIECDLSCPYPLDITFLTHIRSDEFHKRGVITNYHYIKSEHGFSAFIGDTVVMETDIDVYNAFTQINSPFSDLSLDWISERIGKISREYNSTSEVNGKIPSRFICGSTCRHRLLE